MSGTATELRATAARIPDRIVEAAATVMEREGFEGASLREIATAAEISKQGLYYHAPSKEFLLFAIHDRFASWLIERGEAILEADLTAEAKLRELIAMSVGGVPWFRPMGLVFLREYRHLSGELRELIGEQRSRFLEIYELIIDEGRTSGEFGPGDDRLDALTLIGSVNWASMWFDPDGRLSAEEVSEEIANRLLSGMLAREEGPAGAAGSGR